MHTKNRQSSTPARGNRALHSKESILAHAKNLLKVLLPAIQQMPKIERWDGAAPQMRKAAFDMIAHFTTAWFCAEVREENVRLMFGDYGRLTACFELLICGGLLSDTAKYGIAIELEKIEEGIGKWHSTLLAVVPPSGAEAQDASVSMDG